MSGLTQTHKLLRGLHRTLVWRARQIIGSTIDFVFGVNTDDRSPDLLEIESKNQNSGVAYDPTPWFSIWKIIRMVPGITNDFTFVDFGCGKGRVVLVASTFPFKKVIGVDFSRALCRIADNNLLSKRNLNTSAREVYIICEDATQVTIPDGPCLFFFYNPFTWEITDKVVNNIYISATTSPRTLYLIFVGVSDDLTKLQKIPFLHKIVSKVIRSDLIHQIPVTIYEVIST